MGRLRLGAAVMLIAVLTCGAQTAPDQRRSKWTEVTLRMRDARVTTGAEPVALLYADNLTHEMVRMNLRNYHIHLKGEKGEPAKTQWFHQVLGDPGYAPLAGSRVESAEMVMPGHAYRMEYGMNAFFLALPAGSYSLFLEIQDPTMESAGEWLTTNTVEFEVVGR